MADRDQTQAEALRIAQARLKELGWSYSYGDIGKAAAQIIKAMDAELINVRAT